MTDSSRHTLKLATDISSVYRTARASEFKELTKTGIPAAFADTDQLCMCYPAPAGDPGRQRIKAQDLDAMIVNYRAAGTRCMIVNGVVDPVTSVQSDLLPQAALTVCRLRADQDGIVRRFAQRQP